MDPVAAIGLASNIVQFVDLSWRLLCDAKELYKSSTGASAENDIIETISRDILLRNDGLKALSTPGITNDSMSRLTGHCIDVASDLLKVLDTVKIKTPHKKWKSFVQALRSVWGKEQIESLVKRLVALRDEIQFNLQLMLSERSSEIYKELENLAAENRKLALDGAHQLDHQMKGVQKAISQLAAELKRQKSRPKVAIGPMRAPSHGGDILMRPPLECMTDLSRWLSSLAEEASTTASNQVLLKSLWFKNLRERQSNVALSHRETFKWVLEPSSLTQFERWLRSHSGIYWIMGKAGSGKSTLMKFLVQNPQTVEMLQEWAGAQRLVTASFFFWNAGTAMQKSQEGLFRSLLYEILRQCPDLIPTVCASKVENFRPFAEPLESWTREELFEAIGQLKQQSGVRARFCFFIDGLDEYDGDPDHLLEALESFRSWPEIKRCVSSRPWNEFADAFSQPSDLRLALEDLTREDIRLYVRDTLEDNTRFTALKAQDSRSQDLVQEIVEKARGVFLWVTLVVKSLLNGLRNADRISHLQRRLRDFPETLEKYFGHILRSVEKYYREETAQAFTFALEAAEPLSLLTYSFLDEDEIDALATFTDYALTSEVILARQEDTRRRLNGRCKGLLEVTSDEGSGRNLSETEYVLCTPKVDFLHRTVHDFLRTKDMQLMLAQNLKADFEPNLRLCKALLAQLKRLDLSKLTYNNRGPYDLLQDLVFYAHKLEIETDAPQVALMDEVGETISKQGFYFNFAYKARTFLSFLAQRKLHLYVGEVLAREPPLTTVAKTDILASMIPPKQTKYFPPVYDSQMIELLLENGATPNGMYGNNTIWGHLLRSIDKRGGPTLISEHLLQVIESMLVHGADPDLKVVIDKGGGGGRRATGRAADLYKADRTKSAREILCRAFGDERADLMLSKFQPRNASFLSSMTSWVTGARNGMLIRRFTTA